MASLAAIWEKQFDRKHVHVLCDSILGDLDYSI